MSVHGHNLPLGTGGAIMLVQTTSFVKWQHCASRSSNSKHSWVTNTVTQLYYYYTTLLLLINAT